MRGLPALQDDYAGLWPFAAMLTPLDGWTPAGGGRYAVCQPSSGPVMDGF